MVKFNKHLPGFGAAFVLACGLSVVATPSFAQRSEDHENHMSSQREQALRECNAAVAKYKQYTWGHQEIDIYRTCMANHGQQE
jgi:hypothetical protein